jgi:predicted ATPase
MLTRIEIDGFKTFEDFGLDLRPLTAIVGPNASGKSNLFDAIRFLSLLAQHDIFTAMQSLRGLPEELFRRTPTGSAKRMTFAVELLLGQHGEDAFGTAYSLRTQRIRYELTLDLARDRAGLPRAVIVSSEHCDAIAKKDDRATWLRDLSIAYSGQLSPFIRKSENRNVLEIRQDGPNKRGNPVSIPLKDTPRTALSTISTAEFPHLYAVKQYLSSITFLELNPSAARNPNDRFEERELRSDASNLSSVLARLKEETATQRKPDGVLADISADLSSLIPSVKNIKSHDDILQRQFAFGLELHDGNNYSSRVISDGTLRLLALLTVLNDPKRQGTLCFEEPENGVHEGRMALLVDLLRHATSLDAENPFGLFQILVNTHSPAVMSNLEDHEIVAADLVTYIHFPGGKKSKRTRMRTGIAASPDLYNPENYLTRAEIETLLRRVADAA